MLTAFSSLSGGVSSGMWMSAMRRMWGRRPTFSTSTRASSSLGMMAWLPVNNRILVERSPMSSTTPSYFSKMIRSPTRKGRSAMSITVPKTVLSVSCAASATARPPTPVAASNVVTGNPR